MSMEFQLLVGNFLMQENDDRFIAQIAKLNLIVTMVRLGLIRTWSLDTELEWVVISVRCV